MEDRLQVIKSKGNSRISIGIMPGHYATNHSHVNYYVDMTSIKTSWKMAKEAAWELGKHLGSTYVDTIICLEETEILGAFLAEYLSQGGINQGNDINLITPELNAVNQMIFRDNVQKKIWGKKVLVLVSSVSTGQSIDRAADCLKYYNGELAAIGAIFSAISKVGEREICSLFTADDLPRYESVSAAECPLCRNGVKVDALINSFGYSKL
ncbi:MAG: orotate phosphoribosyltransferase [Oscillospiraceae bacterium]|nr:orotate phosphoribosyltransferase [Oscillospiraceae bacterium]